MDILTLSLAVKKALAELGIGKTMEPGILEWDGDITGLEPFQLADTLTVYKISDRFITAKEIKGFTLKATDIDISQYIESDQISFDDEANTSMTLSNYDDFIVMSVKTDMENGLLKKGTYTNRIFDNVTGAYIFIGAIHGVLTETIHPIDPKFIPAFDSITLNGADGKQYKLSVDESGTLVHTAIEGA